MIKILLLAAATVAAQQPPVAPPPTHTQSDGDKIVCKRIEETGSRLSSSKVCMTKSQWAERTRNDQDNLNQQLRRQCNPGEGGAC